MTTPFVPQGMKMPAYAVQQGMETPYAVQGMMSVPEMAGAAEQVVKDVMRVEPMIAGIAGMFVPGLSLVQPWIVMLAPYLERALDDVSKGNNGDVLSSLIELIQHITKGGPNSPVLSTTIGESGNTVSSSARGLGYPPSQDPSAQGSG